MNYRENNKYDNSDTKHDKVVLNVEKKAIYTEKMTHKVVKVSWVKETPNSWCVRR